VVPSGGIKNNNNNNNNNAPLCSESKRFLNGLVDGVWQHDWGVCSKV